MPQATKEQVEALGRALCAFGGVDPDETISDSGHTVLQWVTHYDVPRVAELLKIQMPEQETPSSAGFPATLGY